MCPWQVGSLFWTSISTSVKWVGWARWCVRPPPALISRLWTPWVISLLKPEHLAESLAQSGPRSTSVELNLSWCAPAPSSTSSHHSQICVFHRDICRRGFWASQVIPLNHFLIYWKRVAEIGLYSYHSNFLSVLQTHLLRAFAFVVPCAWNSLIQLWQWLVPCHYWSLTFNITSSERASLTT